MAKARTLVGLDVHAAKIVAAILDSETGELRFQRLGGESGPAVDLCRSLPGTVRATYEAGPTGYGLARGLLSAGVDCLVAAPGKIPRGATDRVKTDRHDAEHLVRLLLAGKLSAVRVPGPPEEAMRDLVRAREDLRMDLMRSRHRLSKLLLRHEIRFEGNNWTERHLAWLAKLEFSDPAAQATFEDYLGGVEALLHRRGELDRRIEGLIETSPWASEVGRLRCLRGVDTLTAIGLCVEVGDFARFAKAGQLMSYLGLVPCEHSTGEARRLGSITKSGSRHARRLLVEAAWHYRNPPRVGREIQRRQQDQPPAAVAVAWSAQRRLHRTYTRMRKRNKRATVTTIAVARELAGFCWAITQLE
ncbi:MAG: IS110 family transposase [Actinobacteria bacterium]|nr:IS110 family transposase [Actinomycetota bacterium]